MTTIKINPESFETLYLRAEDGTILTTTAGRRIIVQRIIPLGWKPVRVYEYEYQLNENKREIKLVDRNYLEQVDREFRRLIK